MRGASVIVIGRPSRWPASRDGTAGGGAVGVEVDVAVTAARAGRAGECSPSCRPGGQQADAAPDPVEGAVRRHLVVEPAGPEVVDQGVEALLVDVTEEAPVDREAGGVPAQGQALGVLEGEHARPSWCRPAPPRAAPRRARAGGRRPAACRRCWCRRPPGTCRPARGGTCRRRSPCRAPRRRSDPSSSPTCAMPSSVR